MSIRPFDPQIPRPPLPEALAARLNLGDVDIEIGAGRGLFAIRYAGTHPERTLVALERTEAKFAGMAHRKAAHPHLSNLFCARADAVAVFTHYVPASSVNRIYLFYPNPYPKAGQAKRRWANQPVMSLLKAALKPNGKLILATNLKWYAEEASSRLTRTWGFALREHTEVAPGTPGRTHFEKKYLDRGETCFAMEFVKPESLAE